jgi:hypothetical protein
MDDAQVFEAMAAALVERGLATPDQVAADRAAQPFSKPPESATAAQTTTVDTTNLPAAAVDPQAAALDQSVFAGPASPDGYRFIAPPNGFTHDPAQAAAVAAAFHDVGLPVSIARQADQLYNAALQAPPTEAQLESSRQQAHLTLARTFGDDSSKVIAVAQKEFLRLEAKAPQLRDMAERSGLGNNPMLIASLYHNARAKGRA